MLLEAHTRKAPAPATWRLPQQAGSGSCQPSGVSMNSLLLKCLLGALAVLLIALLSRPKSFVIAGLVPLFPTFALIAHYIIGAERSVQDLRTTALNGP